MDISKVVWDSVVVQDTLDHHLTSMLRSLPDELQFTQIMEYGFNLLSLLQVSKRFLRQMAQPFREVYI